MNQKERIKSITDGAIIAAIYAVFLLASRFIGGLLESYLYFILPIPITIYGYKYSVRNSLVVAVSSALISFLCIANPLNVVFYVLPGLVVGVIYPVLLKKKINTVLEVLFTSSLSFLITLFTSVIFGYLFDYDIVEDTIMMVDEIMNVIEQLGVESVTRALIEALMTSIIPATLILSAIIEGLVLSLLTNFILVRMKLKPKMELRSFNLDHVPSFIGWLYILVFLWMVISLRNILTDDKVLFVIYSIIINIGLVFSCFMIYQGLYYVAKWAKLTRHSGIYLLAALSIFVMPYIMIVFGVLQNIMHLSAKLVPESHTDGSSDQNHP